MSSNDGSHLCFPMLFAFVVARSIPGVATHVDFFVRAPIQVEVKTHKLQKAFSKDFRKCLASFTP
ncbi:MAG: hypothetical protein QM749_13990 [Aquabacterium sp.]